ncbi:MAG: hypothetical protein ACFFCS_24690 [Candidatus Hodarchaeota archaeon]
MEIRQNDTLKDILHRSIKDKIPVTITTNDGKSLTGTVSKVMEHVVVVELKGNKSFFDAILRIDAINAVEYQARKK